MPPAEARGGSFVSGVLLAAGASRRMGRPKQLLPLGDRCLLQQVIDEAAASCLAEVVIVLGCSAQEIAAAISLPPEPPVRVVINEDYAGGQAGSLLLGLRSSDPRATAAAILLGDQPGVGADLIDRMVAAFMGSALPLARPLYRDLSGAAVPGHPVLIDRALWPELEKLGGDQGLRALLPQWRERLLEVAVEGEGPGDIDTPGDYDKALRGARAARYRNG